MNEIEKQILKNQVDIMRNLIGRESYMNIRLQETSDLLNPEGKSKEPCCEMDEKDKNKLASKLLK